MGDPHVRSELRRFAPLAAPALLAATLIAWTCSGGVAQAAGHRPGHGGGRGMPAPAGAPAGEPGPGAIGEASGEPPRPPRARRERCLLVAAASAERVATGEAVTLSGRLECAQAAADAQPVAAYVHAAGSAGSGPAGETTTLEDGSFTLTTSALDVNSVLYVRSGGARSRRIPVKVVPLLTLHGSYPDGAQLPSGGRSAGSRALSRVTFTGRVTPAGSGATVALLREDAGRDGQWRRIGLAPVAADGTYQLTHAFHAPGQVTLRALVRMPGSLPGASEPLSYTIAPHQNPRLTIGASANPVAEGQPVRITGTAAAAGGETLKLLARTGQRPFAVVADAGVGANGSYEFTVPPLGRSTAFQVQGARTRSIVLRIAVKYALAQSASPRAVAAGQTLTFSGSVLPAQAGHQVFLQRENATGIGFHTVEEAITGADGSYSVTHLFAAGDAGVYRIRVPREAGLEGGAGEPFSIAVTAGTAQTPSA